MQKLKAARVPAFTRTIRSGRTVMVVVVVVVVLVMVEQAKNRDREREREASHPRKLIKDN